MIDMSGAFGFLIIVFEWVGLLRDNFTGVILTQVDTFFNKISGSQS